MNKFKKIVYDILFKYQGLVILLILIDQITKLIALKSLHIDNNPAVKIFGWDWLQFRFVFNDGAALSIGGGGDNQLLFALVSLFASIAIECFLLIKKPKDKILNILLLVILAGAVGNGIDRFLALFPNATGYEGVIDFIYVSWFSTFNVADIYVTCSCVVMMVYFIFAKDEDKKQLQKKENNNE